MLVRVISRPIPSALARPERLQVGTPARAVHIAHRGIRRPRPRASEMASRLGSLARRLAPSRRASLASEAIVELVLY